MPALAIVTSDRPLVQPLQHRAMNAHLSIECPSFQKTDRKLARKVAEDTGGDAAMHRHTRLLLAKGALAEIQSVINEARTFHREHTSPWEDGGLRILSSMMYPVYMPKMNEFKARFDAAADKFEPVYPALMEQAKPLLGDAWNEADYPHPLRIRSRFSFGVRLANMPASDDFRCPDIGADEEERIRRDLDERNKAALDGVVRDLWTQMNEHVTHMVDRLVAYEEREDRRGKDEADLSDRTGFFRDTLVTNLRDLVERLPMLNLTGDPQIEQMRQRMIATLCVHDPEDLRKSPLTRRHVLDQAKVIQSAVMQQAEAIGAAVSELI